MPQQKIRTSLSSTIGSRNFLVSYKETKSSLFTAMLGANALNCYDVDVDALNSIAARIGPLKSDFIDNAA